MWRVCLMTYVTTYAGESMYYVVVCMRVDMYALRRMFVGARMFACTTEQIDWILHAFAGLVQLSGCAHPPPPEPDEFAH